jgi:hypothetical protein
MILSRRSLAASLAWGNSRDAGSALGYQTIKSYPGSGLKGSSRHPTPLIRQFFRRNFYRRWVVVLIWVLIWVVVSSFPRSSPAKMWTRNSGQEDNDHYFLYTNAATCSRCFAIWPDVHPGLFYNRNIVDFERRDFVVIRGWIKDCELEFDAIPLSCVIGRLSESGQQEVHLVQYHLSISTKVALCLFSPAIYFINFCRHVKIIPLVKLFNGLFRLMRQKLS